MKKLFMLLVLVVGIFTMGCDGFYQDHQRLQNQVNIDTLISSTPDSVVIKLISDSNWVSDHNSYKFYYKKMAIYAWEYPQVPFQSRERWSYNIISIDGDYVETDPWVTFRYDEVEHQYNFDKIRKLCKSYKDKK